MPPRQESPTSSWSESETVRRILEEQGVIAEPWLEEQPQVRVERTSRGAYVNGFAASNNVTRNKRNKMLDKTILKQRHLNRDERADYHDPNPDWVNTPTGEVCRSACTLPIEDLVVNIK